jgi:hypothetical protein
MSTPAGRRLFVRGRALEVWETPEAPKEDLSHTRAASPVIAVS